MNSRIFIVCVIVLTLVVSVALFTRSPVTPKKTATVQTKEEIENQGGLINQQHPLSIAYMRSQEYPGSDFVTEQTLPNGFNYTRSIVSYKSDGLKIYALLTVPLGEKPATGWPVIIFNHGYIPPTEYRTTERYIAYTDAFSRNGYIVLKSDYRGHGNSEGTSQHPDYSPFYTIDILNAISSVKKLTYADANRIGMWGHSMGGSVTMRALAVSKDIKAADIWAGVVGSYPDMTEFRRPGGNRARSTVYGTRPTLPPPDPAEPTRRPNGRQLLADQYGDFAKNPEFWKAIDPVSYIGEITAPIQLQHGTADTSVSIKLSELLYKRLKDAGKQVTFYQYEGDDHNIANNLSTALTRSVDFFDSVLKK